jgi:hypothetical protein
VAETPEASVFRNPAKDRREVEALPRLERDCPANERPSLDLRAELDKPAAFAAASSSKRYREIGIGKII